MMTASLAFALQGMCVAASEAATGDSSHYYLGFAFHHPGGNHSHLVTHRHADGTVHTHAVDDGDGALADHVKQPGWNMALVICVVPAVAIRDWCRPWVGDPCPARSGRQKTNDEKPPPALGRRHRWTATTAETPQHSLAARGHWSRGRSRADCGSRDAIPRL